MGNSSSKAARTAAGSTTRKYPSRATGITSTPASKEAQRPAQQAYPSRAEGPAASSTRNEAVIDMDGRDPQLAASLRAIGPVKPAPTFSNSAHNPADGSPSSTPSRNSQNPSLATLAARQRMQEVAEQEKVQVGKQGFQGKTLVDVNVLHRILVMRDEQGLGEAEIERSLGLKQGVVKGLGIKGLVEVA